jgi:hypothetical protein
MPSTPAIGDGDRRPAPREGRSGIAVTAACAGHALRTADKLERRRAFDGVDARFKVLEAVQLRAEGEHLLARPASLIGDVRHELVPAPTAPETLSFARQHVLCTLEEPSIISIDASEHRAHAASKAGVLSAALDAAASAGAETSLEKMLAHQVAAVHHAGMELPGHIADDGLTRLPPVERARLTNAAARLFEVAQAGCLTLQRLKTGGKQTVVVQHVSVSEGGQAVVAGRLEGGRPRRGRPQD